MIELAVPSSKSVTQRALLLAALAPGESRLSRPLDCDDSRGLAAALTRMGAAITIEGELWRVAGGGLRFPSQAVDCGQAGTTARFLAALPLVIDGTLRLDGSPRLRERPMGPLTAALAALGVEVSCGGRLGSLPLSLCRRVASGARVTLDASASSQFASALLLVAPLLPNGLTLELAGEAVSRPYLELTAETMAAFGATVERHGERTFCVPPARYRPCTLAIEGDWSAAAFVLVASRLAGVPVSIASLRSDSRQPDRAILEVLRRLDEPGPRRIDLRDAPDIIGAVTAAALFATGPTTLCGLAHTRLKESDRLAVLARELPRLGARVEEHVDGLTITPAALHGPARLDPAADHRMAMTFGVLGLRVPGLVVADRACVSKSFPDFWDVLARLA